MSCHLLLLLVLLGVVCAGAPTPGGTASRLDEDESRTFLRGWLLFDDPTSEGARRKGPTAKSVFIAPVVKDLPDCAQGYYADALGRCHKIVQINQAAQLGFLLQKLNAMYANNDKFIKRASTTEGPVQVPIPLQLQVKPVATETTEAPPVTEQVDMVVVAAEVQIKDERESISLPGAIVTLWHLNTTAAPDTESTQQEEQTSTLTSTEEGTTSTETTFSTDTTLITDTRAQDGTTPIDTKLRDGTTDTSGTTLTTDIRLEDGTTLTTDRLQLQDGTTTTIDLDSTVSEITSETTEVPTSETTPMATEESTTELPPTRATPTILRIQIPEVVDSDLSSANSAEPPLTLELPGSEHQTWDEQPARWPPKDEIHGEEQQGSWSWGPWNRASSTPRPPLYLNFWSSQPHVPDPTIRTRTGLRRPPSRYPATFNGRPAPLYYQELTGQDVATVFRNQNAWYRGQRQ